MRTISFSKFVVLFLGIGLVSCSSDDNGSTTDSLNVPEAYEFNRNDQSTVDFSGQSNRLLMLTEIGNYIKNQGVAGNVPLAAAFSIVPIAVMAIYISLAKRLGAFDAF